MATQNSTIRKLNLVLATAIAVFGLGFLWAQPEPPAGCLMSLLCSAANGLVELLPCLVRATCQGLGDYAFDHLLSSAYPLHHVVSFLLLLRVLAGAA